MYRDETQSIDLESHAGEAPNRNYTKSEYIKAKPRPPRSGPVLGLASLFLVGTPVLAQDAGEGGSPRGESGAGTGGVVQLEDVNVEAATWTSYNPQNISLQRLPTSILDTPSTINVIPQQVMQDQHTQTVVEALHNAPGITFFGGEGGTQGDNINIRGYSARNDFYRDGIRDPGWYTRDAFSIESIEVLKGPASFLFGRGSTGGVVNMTSKLPQFANFTTIEMSGYTAPGARVTADVNRMLADNVAARIVLLGNDTGVAGRDDIVTKRIGVAPSLRVDMAKDWRLTLSYIFQKDDNIPDYGIPLLPGSYFGTPYGQPAPVNRDTYFGRLSSTLPDTEKVDAHIITMRIDHDLSQDWKVSNETRYSYIDRFVRVRGVQIGTQAPGSTANLYSAATGGTLLNPVPYGYPLSSLYVANTNDFQNHTQNSLLTNQTDLTGHFDTGFLKHTVTTGIELSTEQRSHYRTTFVPGDRVDVGDPNPYPANPGSYPATSTIQDDLSRTIGVYASDQVKLNRYLEVLGGLRYDSFEAWQYAASVATGTLNPTGQYNATTPYNLQNPVTYVSWRAGPVVHPTENSSIYYMHGTSFDPPSEYLVLTGGQQNLQPTTNATDEIGAKVNLLSDKLSLDGALFRTVQQNAIEAINSGLGLYAEVGTTRVQGYELGVAGKLTDLWSVYGGYTFMQGRVLASATSQTTGTFVSAPGDGLQNVPRNTLTLTSTYQILPKLTVGGSMYFVDKRWTSSADVGLVPGYTRFDAMASYKIDEHATVQLNLINLANTTNYETISGYGSATPGPGRSAIATIKMKF